MSEGAGMAGTQMADGSHDDMSVAAEVVVHSGSVQSDIGRACTSLFHALCLLPRPVHQPTLVPVGFPEQEYECFNSCYENICNRRRSAPRQPWQELSRPCGERVATVGVHRSVCCVERARTERQDDCLCVQVQCSFVMCKWGLVSAGYSPLQGKLPRLPDADVDDQARSSKHAKTRPASRNSRR